MPVGKEGQSDLARWEGQCGGGLLGWGVRAHACPWLLCVLQERKLCAHPRIEIYKQDCIYFVCPLARQGDFYVPEMKELERKSRAAAAVAEDAQTDITGIRGLRTGSILDRHQPSQRWGPGVPSPAARADRERLACAHLVPSHRVSAHLFPSPWADPPGSCP